MHKFCPKCGHEIGDGDLFCSYCGTKANDNTPNDTTTNPPQPIETPNTPNETPETKNPKSKILAGILGICLGFTGIHNLYLGYSEKAVVQLIVGLVLGLFTCFLSTIAVEIWGIVEGILILTGSIKTDADGIPLK